MTDSLSVVYFPAAVALGALHALEPGHAKALTASYLIGIKGTKRDSVILGLSVATTHSIIVISISAIGLWLGNAAFTGEATAWLERSSGLVAIAIGGWMLWRRLFVKKGHESSAEHHHAPDPVRIGGHNISGLLEIVETPLGERMRFAATQRLPEDQLFVEIDRDNSLVEKLTLSRSPENEKIYLSASAPKEPHEFVARLIWIDPNDNIESIAFQMSEPEHHHSHDHLDDIAHAKAHAEHLPEYAKNGVRASIGQIITFGAAGGMIPCPASITVMLLALSTGKAGIGILTVLGFSLGLAIALVGIGVLIVTGLRKLSETGRLSWIARQAPVVSAGLVILSGVFALMFVH